MNYEIILTKTFKRDFKPLLKKYRSLLDDLEGFKNELLKNPEMGDDLGNNTRKIRMAVASKNKGKSGGARVITFDVVGVRTVETLHATSLQRPAPPQRPVVGFTTLRRRSRNKCVCV
jgi:mRNA-degrading endonuclease RelE of RelBE toxin-antitoxin system